jgi:hypothetical protein
MDTEKKDKHIFSHRGHREHRDKKIKGSKPGKKKRENLVRQAHHFCAGKERRQDGQE